MAFRVLVDAFVAFLHTAPGEVCSLLSRPVGACTPLGGAQLLALLLVDATGGRLLRDFQDRRAFLSPCVPAPDA